jgi:hypothetical protein
MEKCYSLTDGDDQGMQITIEVTDRASCVLREYLIFLIHNAYSTDPLDSLIRVDWFRLPLPLLSHRKSVVRITSRRSPR